MPSDVRASAWLTAKALHQIQLLSCDLCDFYAWESPDHCAPFWRLYWHQGHGAEITVFGKRISLQPGRLMLIPPHTHFASALRKPVRQLFLHFLVEPRLCLEPGTVFDFPAGKELSSYCRQLSTLLTKNTSDLKISLLAQTLISLVLTRLPESRWTPRFEDARITTAVAAIAKAYPTRIPNAQLARSAGMHPSAFGRLFLKCTGHTPLRELLNLRLEEACSLLHNEQSSLEQIAEKTGFSDRGYFTRVFTRHMNCAPGRYRKLVNVSDRKRPGI